MKKFLFLAAALLALGISTACADSDRPIDVAQLPQKAQQFIQKHFPGEKSLWPRWSAIFWKSATR